MMAQQWRNLAVIITLGLATLLGSELEERSPRLPPVPATVSFTVAGPGQGLARELATRTDRLDSLRLVGRYAADLGQRLTLTRTSVTFDAGSSFTLTVIPSDASELLDGAAEIDITEALDVGLARDPTDGQFTSQFDGTTTVVTASASGVDIEIGDAATATSLSWRDFSALAADDGAALDERMASAAYNMLRVVLRALRLAEDAIDDVEDNKGMLESMNLNTQLELPCDNGSDDGNGESGLIWRRDATGDGQGTIGRGDDFEARYDNCLRAARSRFLDGEIDIRDYLPQTGSAPRSLGADIEFGSLFVAENPVDFATTPSASTPRYDGQIDISYVEAADSE